VTVSEVLIHVPLIRLRKIIASYGFFWISGKDCGALIQVYSNVALQMNR